jgi:hypothetical protein
MFRTILITLTVLAAGMFTFLYALTPPNMDIGYKNMAPVEVR